MTKEELAKIIKQEENPKLDFKRDYEEKKENTDYISDIVSIANGNIENIGETGYLIFGIQEKPKEIYGVEIDKELQDIKRHLAEKLNNHITPNITNIDVKDFHFGSKRVIVVIIPFQESILLLKKNIKQSKYRAFDFLYRIGEGIQVISNANDSKFVDEFKIKIDGYKENKKISEQLKLSGENFETKREKNEAYGSYKNQKDRVSLFATLPIINDVEARLTIECEIEIILENSIKIITTILEKDILLSLFSGYKFEPKDKDNKREWIVFFDEKSNLYTIKLSSTILDVSYKTVKILSEMLDDLQEIYAFRLNNIGDRLNSKKFPYSKEYKNGFELLEMDSRFFQDIRDYIHNFSKKDKWNVFGDNIFAIEVLNNDKVSMLFRYKINAYIDDFRISTPSSKVTIIWDTLAFYKFINKPLVSVEESYDWFVNKLIPKVIEYQYEKKKSSKWFNKKVENSKLKDKSYLQINDFRSDENDNNSLVVSAMLVEFFTYNKVSITKNILRGLYKGLKILFENSKKLDNHYLYKKFYNIGNKKTLPQDYEKSKDYLNRKPTKECFLERINIEINEINKGHLSISELLWGCCTFNHILSCYTVIIRDNFDSYSDVIIYDIEQSLKGLKEIYNIIKVGERRLLGFS